MNRARPSVWNLSGEKSGKGSGSKSDRFIVSGPRFGGVRPGGRCFPGALGSCFRYWRHRWHQLDSGHGSYRRFDLLLRRLDLLLHLGTSLLDLAVDVVDLRSDGLLYGASGILHRCLEGAQFFQFDFTVDIRLDLGYITLQPPEQVAQRLRHARQPLGADHDERDHPNDENLGCPDIEHDCGRKEGARSALGLVLHFTFECLGGIRAVQPCSWFVVIRRLHAILEALYRTAEIRADVAQLLGAEYQQHHDQNDQPMPDTE